ncbi:hypothetical protein PFRI_13130 [Planktotalea frisia]|uniref:Uncharacterized protein n=1 Tax=Planktotalea frisia TaxID=696762 RepID=A0A1L9NZ61_9RHOB|nr:hypothetical protein PFRI_13130 [Planktotalea frisia]
MEFIREKVHHGHGSQIKRSQGRWGQNYAYH